MWLRVPTLLIALVAAILLLSSGFGARLGLWHFATGFGLLRWATYLGIAAALAAIVALALPGFRRGGIVGLAIALVLGAVSAAVPFEFQRRARSVPPIHDLTTDTDWPPQFVAIVALRAGAPNPPGYAGKEVAELQRKAYPDIQPLALGVPPAMAFSRALAAAEAMGWEIVAKDQPAGRLEAVATTFWFGFKDDVVVRIAPAPPGSRIDVRSKSRVGRSDAGTNARRIREYLERLK